MIFETEKDVRRWIASQTKSVRWVEPALGSTFGLPDCFVPVGIAGQVCFLELKLGEDGGKVLRYNLRPPQASCMRGFKRDGLLAGIIVGIKGTDRLWAVANCEEAMGGRIDVSAAIMGEAGSTANEVAVPISTQWKEPLAKSLGFILLSDSDRMKGHG